MSRPERLTAAVAAAAIVFSLAGCPPAGSGGSAGSGSALDKGAGEVAQLGVAGSLDRGALPALVAESPEHWVGIATSHYRVFVPAIVEGPPSVRCDLLFVTPEGNVLKRVKRPGWLLGTHEAVAGGFLTVQGGRNAAGELEVHVVVYGPKGETLRDDSLEGDRRSLSLFPMLCLSQDARRLAYMTQVLERYQESYGNGQKRPAGRLAFRLKFVNEEGKVRAYPGPGGGIVGLFMSQDGRRLALVRSHSILLVDLDGGQVLHQVSLLIGRVPSRAVLFDPSGDHLFFLARTHPEPQQFGSKPIARSPLALCRLKVATGKVVGKHLLGEAQVHNVPDVLGFTETGRVRLRTTEGWLTLDPDRFAAPR